MPRRGTKNMGEGGGFPWVRAVVSLVTPESPMACPSTKGVLESGFEWVIKSLPLFLVLSRSLNTPLYPFKCWKLGTCPKLLTFLLFNQLTFILSLTRSLRVRHATSHFSSPLNVCSALGHPLFCCWLVWHNAQTNKVSYPNSQVFLKLLLQPLTNNANINFVICKQKVDDHSK